MSATNNGDVGQELKLQVGNKVDLRGVKMGSSTEEKRVTVRFVWEVLNLTEMLNEEIVSDTFTQRENNYPSFQWQLVINRVGHFFIKLRSLNDFKAAYTVSILDLDGTILYTKKSQGLTSFTTKTSPAIAYFPKGDLHKYLTNDNSLKILVELVIDAGFQHYGSHYPAY